MIARTTLSLALLATAACGDGDLTPEESLDESCNGEVIPNCRPYEYAIVREASIGPENIEVGDPLATVDVRFEIDACADAPMAHAVALEAVDESGGGVDGGVTGRMTTLDTFYDDGPRDENPAEGVFEATVENVFLSELVSPETELILTFEPRIDVCRGGTVELSYRTGPAYEGP